MRATARQVITGLALVILLPLMSNVATAAGEANIYVDPNGSDENPGTADAPMKTLYAATNQAERNNREAVGTTVHIAPGVYRESILLERGSSATDAPITFEGSTDGEVVVAGSDVFDGWTPSGDGDIVTHSWTNDWGLAPVPAGWASYFATRNFSPLLQRRELVVVGGRLLRQVLSLDELRATPAGFYVDEGADTISMRRPVDVPADAQVEVGMRSRLFNADGWRNITLRRMAFVHSTATFQDAGVRFIRSSDIRVEDSRFDVNNWGGFKLLESSRATIVRSTADHNGVMGFSGWRISDIAFEDTQNNGNNWRGHWSDFHGWDTGSKFFSVRRLSFNNHRSIGNLGHGLWLDTDNADVSLTNSTVADNYGHGLFLEAIQGPIRLTGNTICNNGEAGIFDAKANGVTLSGNRVFGNRRAQVDFNGEPGGRSMTTWDTGQPMLIRSEGWTVTGNTLATLDAAQPLYRTTLSSAEFGIVTGSMVMGGNTYQSSVAPDSFVLPLAKRGDLSAWQAGTGRDADSVLRPATGPLACDGSSGAPVGEVDVDVESPAPVLRDLEVQPTPSPTPRQSAPIPAASESDARRLAGDSRVATSVAISAERTEGAETVVIAPSGSPAEALVSAPLAAATDGPVLLNGAGGLEPAVASEVERLGASTAYVVGRPDQLAPAVEDALRSAGVQTVIRLAEPDVYALSVRVARTLLPLTGRTDAPRVLIALGEAADPSRAWPDALCASAVAAHVRAPILLTRGTELPAPVAALLTELSPDLVQVVGGTAAIKDNVFAAAQAAAGPATMERLAGSSRYATSVAVAEAGLAAGLDAPLVWVATGRAFPDALAAGPAAAREGAPLLLVDGAAPGGAPESEAWLSGEAARLATATIVGGTAAISPAVSDQINSLVAG